MRAAAVAIMAALVVAGCTSGSGPAPGAQPSIAPGSTPPSGSATSTGDPTGGTSPSPSPSLSVAPSARPDQPTEPPDAAAIAATGLAWETVADEFEGPLQVLAHPVTGDTLVVEQAGRVRSLDGDTLLDIADRVAFGGERGLLGATFHPDGERLFLHYSATDGATTLSEFPVADDGSVSDDETVLFTAAQPASNHNGGSVLFGPDGFLYLALGDGGAGNDRFGNGQDASTVLGALLRLDVDTDPGTAQPADGNPYLDGGGAPEVWAIGLRNPYRVWFHEGRLVIADVGQDAAEEVDVVEAGTPGRNYGWPAFEGTDCLQGPCDLDAVAPVVTHTHGDGWCSVIGGVVPADPDLPALDDVYLYSDLCETGLHGIVLGDNPQPIAFESGALPASPLGFGLAADGSVLVGTADGTVLRLVPA